MASLRPTRLSISEKSATYMIKWSNTIIWQVRVGMEINIRDNPYIISAYFWTFSNPPTHYVSTVKLGNKERFDKEQIGIKEQFPVTNLPFTS